MGKLIFGALIAVATVLGSLCLVSKTQHKTGKIIRRDRPKTRSMKSHNYNCTIAIKNCFLCEFPYNKDNKCETHMCEKIKRAISIFSRCRYDKAHLLSQNMGFACNCDDEWITSDYYDDILKNDPKNIKGKIKKYLEENLETRINEKSVRRILREDWPI
jgi:hypothetical protein